MEWQENMSSPSDVFRIKNNTVLGQTFKCYSAIIMFIIQLQRKNYLFGNGLLRFMLTAVAMMVWFPFLLLVELFSNINEFRSLDTSNRKFYDFESLVRYIDASLNKIGPKWRPGNLLAWEGFRHV